MEAPAAVVVPRMRNPLAFTGAGAEDMVAGPASMSAERPRLPAQFQVSSMLTADTRAPPSHRGRGLGGGADKRYDEADDGRRVAAYQSSESFSAAAAVDKPVSVPQKKKEEEGMRNNSSSAWIERARADARATRQQYDRETLMATVVAGLAIAGGALLVASITFL